METILFLGGIIGGLISVSIKWLKNDYFLILLQQFIRNLSGFFFNNNIYLH